MTPHRLGAFTDISKQLIAQSSLDVEGFVRNDLASILALAIDKAVLEGSGASGQPTGILATTGVGSVTFGGAPTWAKVVEFETDVATANADIGTMNYVTTAAVRGAWKTTVKTANQAIFLAEQNSTNGYGLLVTNQVSSDKVIFGAFSAASLGIWGGVDVLVDPYGSQAIAGLVRIVAQTYVDVGVRQAGAFAVSADAGNQ
jgi:HK97 family phage major capsid protein